MSFAPREAILFVKKKKKKRKILLVGGEEVDHNFRWRPVLGVIAKCRAGSINNEICFLYSNHLLVGRLFCFAQTKAPSGLIQHLLTTTSRSHSTNPQKNAARHDKVYPRIGWCGQWDWKGCHWCA
jgi:hypothetical protein